METNQESSAMMTANQSAQLESEVFLSENYEFRHNVLSGKTEVLALGESQRSKVKGRRSEAEGQRHEFQEGSDGPKGFKRSKGSEDSNRNAISDCMKQQLCCTETGHGPMEQRSAQAPAWEVREGQRYWFTREEVTRIQEANLPFYKVNDVEQMLFHCFRLPEAQEAGQWLRGSEIFDTLTKHYPEMRPTRNMQTKIGMTLRFMGCETKHTKVGQCYQLIPLEKAA